MLLGELRTRVGEGARNGAGGAEDEGRLLGRFLVFFDSVPAFVNSFLPMGGWGIALRRGTAMGDLLGSFAGFRVEHEFLMVVIDFRASPPLRFF